MRMAKIKKKKKKSEKKKKGGKAGLQEIKIKYLSFMKEMSLESAKIYNYQNCLSAPADSQSGRGGARCSWSVRDSCEEVARKRRREAGAEWIFVDLSSL